MVSANRIFIAITTVSSLIGQIVFVEVILFDNTVVEEIIS